MGFGGRPPLPTPLAPAAAVLHDTAQTRVTRLFLPDTTVIRKEPLGAGRQRRLRNERTILERLAGVRGVARLAEVSSLPGSILLVDVHGRPLADGAMPLAGGQLGELALALAHVVAAMHSRGVVHRDITPANILLSDDDHLPCLIDFAFATTSADLRPEFTHHNEIVGTLPYLAPEQTGRTSRPVDHRADLYALGATFYELATGAPPFGTGEPLRLIHDHLTLVPTPPVELNPAVDQALSDIIMHLLEKEPDNRYQTAAGLIHDLVRLGNDQSSLARPRIGEHDFPSRPRPPSRLVGRDQELTALKSAFANALSGRHRGVILSGPPGVGKTSLINEMRAVAAANDGWFVAGTFDRFRRDQESDAAWQAFRSLGRLLLAEPEERLAEVRHRLRRTLGRDAALIAALHPEFAAALQVTPDAAIGDPATLPARLDRIGTEIVRAVAASGRPVVFAVDDLQWAGRTPLRMLDRLMNEGSLDGVLLVAAYREDEVEATGALAAMLARWRQLPVGVEHLSMGNLPDGSLAVLLADMLGTDVDQGSRLATLLAPHTGGNPYETVELLRSLSHEGVLEPGATGWRWDTPAIRQRLDNADVAEILAGRAGAMPPPSRTLLQAMACLGGRAELSLLQAATGRCAVELEEGLLPALAGGLLVTQPGPRESVRFRHDRVQEAILCRLGPTRRHAMRLDLARRLARNPDFFAVAAEQYLPVVDSVTDPAERRRVAHLLRRAAEQARLTGNYPVVQRCLASAAELTDPGDSATLRELHTGHHAALYHLGQLEEADEVFAELGQLCSNPAECTDATLTQISSLINRNRPQDAVHLGLDLLEQLGCAAPPPERLAAEVDRELDDLYQWAGECGEGADLDRPEITDRTLLAIGSAINRIVPAAYFLNHTLMAWLALRAWRIWQRHGPGRTLVGPVCHIAYVTISRRQDHLTGYRVLRRIMATSQGRGYEPETSHARFLYSLGGWRHEPIEDNLRLARLAREGLINGGDLQNACFSYYVTSAGLLDLTSLDSYAAELESGLTFARRTGSNQVAEVLTLYRRCVGVLQGERPRPSIDDIGTPPPPETNRPAVAGVHLTRGLVAAVLGDRAELLAHSAAIMELLPALAGTQMTLVAHLLRGLALAEQARAGPRAEHDAAVAELDGTVNWMAARSADAPANSLHLLRLMEAERAWAVGDFRSAAGAFDAAMREAAAQQRPWHRALILEHFARFCLAHGLEHSGQALLVDARQAYLAWGAKAKVDQLDWAFPKLQAPLITPPGAAADRRTAGTSGRSRLMPGAVDLFSILAASRALSSETSIHGLRERVTEVLRTMTGATGVHLLLWSDEQDAWLLTVPGDGDGDGDGATVPLDEAGARGLVPVSAVRYAERTREPLVVGDATRDDRFRRDPYLARLERCSLLAVPIRSRGAVPALLVLENHLIRSAFTAERLDGVTLIAGQLAVSLNNTMVYASLERMVAERTEELAHANERLERLSVTDALTGLANRRRLEEVLTGEWGRAERSGTPIALAMVDIDHFKIYNDHFGHVAGDRCLQNVASLLHREICDVDLAARYGGEEFAIVMPGADLAAAVAAAEKLRTQIVELAEPNPLVAERVVTVSVGVAAIVPDGRRRVELLAERADAQLYRAKRGGRNRVMPGSSSDIGAALGTK